MENLLQLIPVIGNTCRIAPVKPFPAPASWSNETILLETLEKHPAHFKVRETLADLWATAGKLEEAAQLRMEGAILASQLFDEEQEEITLDWDDEFTATVLSTLYASAGDHFSIGDYEMATAMFELLTDHDPEDHLNASELLAFCYVALEEWELWQETTDALPANQLSTQLAIYWGIYQKEKPADLKSRIQKENKILYEELTAEDHDEHEETEVRRLWLRTQTLWIVYPDFIEALK